MNLIRPKIAFKTVFQALLPSATWGFSRVSGPGRAGRVPATTLTSAQREAVAEMNRSVHPLVFATAAARNELMSASLAFPRDEAAIRTRRDALVTAEFALASARAEGFAQIQSSANRLSEEQVVRLIARAAQIAAARGGPHTSSVGPQGGTDDVALSRSG